LSLNYDGHDPFMCVSKDFYLWRSGQVNCQITGMAEINASCVEEDGK